MDAPFSRHSARLGTVEPALGLTNCNVTFYLSGLPLLFRYKVCEDREADSVLDINYLSRHRRAVRVKQMFAVNIQSLCRPDKKMFCDGLENRPSAFQDQVSPSQGRMATWRDLPLYY